MKILRLIQILALVSLLSCDDNEETITIPTQANDITSPIAEGDSPIEKSPDEEVSPILVYSFDHLTGKCLDENKEEGFNFGELGECGDLTGGTLESALLNKKNYYGLILKGSKLIDSKISFHRLAKTEVKIDQDTEFPDRINAPHTSLFLGHSNAFRGHKKNENSYYQKYLELRTRFKDLKKEYKEIPRDNSKARKKKLKQIAKIKKKMGILIKNKKIQKNKSKRQRTYLKKSYKLATVEEKFINQKVKNKKFTSFSGNKSYQFKSSNSVFPSNKAFTISLWFRTDVEQQDKRLINFHRGESPGSALNLSLKNGKVVVGIHDGVKYNSIETEFDYSDEAWHHFLVTKSKNKFYIYIDGQRTNIVESEFSNFGEYPMQLGSYNGKGHYYTGSLDELSLWQSSFGKSDVRRLYNEGQPSNIMYHRKVTSLLHWWRLGDHKRDTDIELIDVVAKETMIEVD